MISAWGLKSRSHRARIVGGYGKVIQRSSTSIDAPQEFRDAVRMYKMPTPPVGRVAHISRGAPRKTGPLEASLVLPGGESLQAATLKSQQARRNISRRDTSRLFAHGNQTLLEHIDVQELRSRPPIQWDRHSTSARAKSAGGTARTEVSEVSARSRSARLWK